MSQAYIVAASRTAGGKRNGRLAGVHPVDLAAHVLKDVVARAQVDPTLIEDVIMGCACPAGQQGANIGRYAALVAGLPETVPGTTVDRQCGSSQQALQFAAATVMSGVQDIVIAAGIESMTRVPMGLPWKLAEKHGYGTWRSPGFNARYGTGPVTQFTGAESLAKKYALSRDELDTFSLLSHQRAAAATRAGRFEKEIVPITVTLPDGETVEHKTDEGIRYDASLAKISALAPLVEGGVVTAGNASQICDGSAAMLVVNEAGLKKVGAAPLARVHHMSVLGGNPILMLEAPITATERALQRSGMTLDAIDIYEVNEAFATVPLAWAKTLHADPARMNVNGGAIALGHPLGASGARLMTTLIHAMHDRKARYGLQTMCEAGGMANVTIIERL